LPASAGEANTVDGVIMPVCGQLLGRAPPGTDH